MRPVASSGAVAATAERLGYRPALDGVRAVAVAAVVAYHAFPDALPGGFAGVDVFLVLSGFLITTLLLEEHDRCGRVSFASFYRRRARRLFPALAAMLAGCVVIAALGLVAMDGRSIVATGSYLTNLIFAFGWHVPVAFGHTWSLALEEQFYLFWPLVLTGAARRGCGIVLALTGGLILASFATATALSHSGAGWERLYFGPDTRSFGLFVGCLLAELRHFDIINTWRPTSRLVTASWATLAVVLLGVHTTTPAAYTGGLAAVCLASAVLVMGHLDGNVLAHPLPVLIGRRSYALYLWHPLVFAVLAAPGRPGRILIAVAVTMILAEASARWVERPFTRRRPRMAAAT